MDSKRKLENGLEPPAKHQKMESRKEPQEFNKDGEFSSDELVKLFEKVPNLAERIFGQLNDQSLVQCNEVSKEWFGNLQNHRVYWIHVIQKYTKNSNGFADEWKKVVHKTPLTTLKNLARKVKGYCKSKSIQQNSPLH